MLRELGLAQGTLTHHLYTLERENLIRRQRHGLRLRFFPISLGVPRTRPLSAWQMRVLEAVHATPGITQSDLARGLGTTRQALHYHIDQLRAAMLLGVSALGRETRLAVSPEVWGRIGRCPSCRTPFETQGSAASAFRCSACGVLVRPVGS